MNKNLKLINNNIRQLSNSTDVEPDNSIILSNSENINIMVDKNNNKLSDYEIYKRSLKMINDDKAKGNKVQISPQFIKYMEQYVDNHDKGIMSDVEFMKNTIYEEVPLTDINLE